MSESEKVDKRQWMTVQYAVLLSDGETYITQPSELDAIINARENEKPVMRRVTTTIEQTDWNILTKEESN